jgi:hypothetical protein
MRSLSADAVEREGLTMERGSKLNRQGGRRVIRDLSLIAGLCLVPIVASGQDRFDDRDRGRDMSRLDPGTTIIVRTNAPIDSDRSDGRVYTATVDQDVRGENGRLAIPRGSNVELAVRVAADNDLKLDIESVVVNGRRYDVTSDPKRIESQKDRSLVGSIVGAINGGRVQGRDVHVPRGTVLTFRLERPLYVHEGWRPRDDDHPVDR